MEDTIEIRFDWGRVYRLMSSHGLDRSQASQVVQGKLCLDKVVHRRRRSEHLAKYLSHCTFAKAARDGRPRLFALHGQQVQLFAKKAWAAAALAEARSRMYIENEIQRPEMTAQAQLMLRTLRFSFRI